jgi:hypothetical protein
MQLFYLRTFLGADTEVTADSFRCIVVTNGTTYHKRRFEWEHFNKKGHVNVLGNIKVKFDYVF